MVETDKLILKFFMEVTRLRITKTILKKNKVKELISLNIKTHHKAKIIKMVWY